MAEEWPDEDFEYRVGTNHLSEFAAGHSPADVLRELVQNEYDAGETISRCDSTRMP